MKILFAVIDRVRALSDGFRLAKTPSSVLNVTSLLIRYFIFSSLTEYYLIINHSGISSSLQERGCYKSDAGGGAFHFSIVKDTPGIKNHEITHFKYKYLLHFDEIIRALLFSDRPLYSFTGLITP